MASAILAFKEAFSSYMKNLAGYAIYSILFSILSAAFGAMAFLSLLVFSALAVGSIASITASGNLLSLDAAGFAIMLLIMLAGTIIYSLVQNGLAGAYFEAIDALLSGRHYSLAKFFIAVPHYSLTMFFASIFALLVCGIPLLAGAAAAYYLGFSVAGILLLAAGILLAFLLSLLFIFVSPAVVIKKKSAIGAMASSVAHIAKSPLSFIGFLAILAFLSIPSFTIVYVPLVLMPISTAALILFFKH
jgi:hypothetical protein